MTENLEPIEINELDERGLRLAAEEIETDIRLESRDRFNPWFIGLWAFNGLFILLSVLGFIASMRQSEYPAVISDSAAQLVNNDTWLRFLAIYSPVLLIFALIGLFTTLALHTVFWER